MANRKSPVLTLKTLSQDRPFIAIDGSNYELASPDDFSLLDQVKLSRLQRRIDSIQASEEMSEEDARFVSAALHEAITMIVLDIPSDVVEKLKDVHCLQIMRVFTEQASLMSNQWTTLMDSPQKLTGESSSQDSSDSMEEAR